MDTRDSELLERWITDRDARAFDQLVTQYAALVYSSSLRILRNAADAEDVTQECFLALADARAKTATSLGAWLYRVATNRSLDYLRKARRRSKHESQMSKDTAMNPTELWNDIQEYVDEAIDALPELSRMAIVASFLERRTHEEIARDLGVT